MDEREFVTRKRETWSRLETIVAKASGRQGVRALSREDLLAFGPLYRRACSDLAYAQVHAISFDLIVHLNGLVGQAHALLYEIDNSRNVAHSIYNFYLYDFPTLLQRRALYFWTAFGISLLGALYAYWFVIANPSQEEVFIPAQFKESVESWKQGKVQHDSSAVFSGQLFANNQRVGLIAYGSGVVAGIPTAYMLFENGAVLGALSAEITRARQHHTFWPGILPHGISELTAIFICGSGGLLLGKGLLFPGRYRRSDSFRQAGLESIYLALGSIPLFIFAGIVEGTFSHLGIPGWVRLTFAGINGTLWYLYLFVPRERPENRTHHGASVTMQDGTQNRTQHNGVNGVLVA